MALRVVEGFFPSSPLPSSFFFWKVIHVAQINPEVTILLLDVLCAAVTDGLTVCGSTLHSH